MEGRTLPHNLEAEQSVLGSALISQVALKKVCERLSPKCFYLDANVKLFETLSDLYSNGVAVDMVTITNKLKETNLLKRIGDVDYLLELINSVPTASNVDYYIDIVAEKFIRRNLIETTNKIMVESYSDSNSTKDVLANAEGKILNTIKNGNTLGFGAKTEERMKTISDIDLTYTEQTFIKTNISNLDRKINGFALGELSIWSGSNASGKSSILGQVALDAINQGNNVAMFSGELTDKRLLNWLTLQLAGKSHICRNEEKNYFYVNPNVKDKILNWLDNKLYLYDNTFGNKGSDILEAVRSCIDKHNIKMVILDNLMSMNLASYGDQKYDVQTRLVTELSALAKEKNVHIHFVCHPRKSLSFLRKNDISGTADLTNIADNVIIIHRVNVDFRTKTKDTFGWTSDNEIYQYSNVLEICKNREYGVEDEFIGLYFEVESKRFLNHANELKLYGWAK